MTPRCGTVSVSDLMLRARAYPTVSIEDFVVAEAPACANGHSRSPDCRVIQEERPQCTIAGGLQIRERLLRVLVQLPDFGWFADGIHLKVVEGGIVPVRWSLAILVAAGYARGQPPSNWIRTIRI